MSIDAIILHTNDNVATAVQELKAGQDVTIRLDRELSHIIIQEDIPYGHKFTLRQVRHGEEILKHGEVIGRATSDIGPGRHAHVHNIESMRGRGDLLRGE